MKRCSKKEIVILFFALLVRVRLPFVEVLTHTHTKPEHQRKILVARTLNEFITNSIENIEKFSLLEILRAILTNLWYALHLYFELEVPDSESRSSKQTIPCPVTSA